MSEAILHIDGQRVTLPQDLKFTFIDQNPFLTKNGQYTYDITLSLLDKNNARIYKNIQRMNFAGVVPSKRNAILIVDNRVLLNGTEVILEKSESEVQIQLVSGNSELNYVSGSTLKIRSLNLGYDDLYGTIIDESSAQWLIDQMDDFENKDHFALPFAIPDSELIGNMWHLYQDSPFVYKLRYSYDGQCMFNFGALQRRYMNVRPQPKLAFIVEKILQALGYDVINNGLRMHEDFKCACLIHGYNTHQWAEMLPDWTVSEFFNQLELFTGHTLVVDNISKEASLIFNAVLDMAPIQKLTVVDEYNDEIDPNRHVTSYKKKNIGYSLDSEEYYKFAVVPKQITDVGEIFDMTDEQNVDTILNNLCTVVTSADEMKLSKIFKTRIGDFIACKDGTTYFPKEIDTLKPVMNNPDESEKLDVELKIIPAAMKVVKLPLYLTPDANDLFNVTASKFYMQLPIVEMADPLNMFEDIEMYDLQNLITGSESVKSQDIGDKMRIAFFTGRRTVDAFASDGTMFPSSYFEHFPVSCVKSLAEYFCNTNTKRWFLTVFGAKPLAPSHLYATLYSTGIQIDETQLHVFEFLNKGSISSMNRFLINDRMYRCERIEYEISQDGFAPLCKGYSYPEI